MREKIWRGVLGAADVVRRYGFCLVWLLALQFVSCLLCWGELSLFGRDFELEWLVYGIGLLLPLVWGLAGYCVPARFRPRGRWQNVAFWLACTAPAAALSFWADRGGPEWLWMAFSPQLMGRLAWFFPVFNGPQSAHVLNTVRPLTTAAVHLLMMMGFLLGLYLGRKK
ncbi:MAG: hypothetical protein HFF44_09220 [Lawsonibacter sp.]|nr:hypothetical protein [Lawsonibacter sp.]